MGFALERVGRELQTGLFRSIGAERYSIWARHARLLHVDDDEIVFSVATTYVKDKLERMLGAALLESARHATNRNVRVVFSPDTSAAEAPGSEFIIGRSNRLAWRSMRKFVDGGDRTLLVTGPSGSGKTHLLREAMRELTRLRLTPVLCLSGAEFARQHRLARAERRLEGFRKKFFGSACILLDDFDFFCGRNDAQDEWLGIFLALAESGKRVALACTKPPRHLEGLSRACRARLRAKAETRLDPPDAALARQILAAAAPHLSSEAIDLACGISANLKDAIEAVRRMDGSIPRARRVVREIRDRWPEGPSLADIVRVAAADFDVRIADLYTDLRSAAPARQACWYLARKLLLEPYALIGRHFGGRDHSTVLHGIRRLEEDADLRARVERIERALVK